MEPPATHFRHLHTSILCTSLCCLSRVSSCSACRKGGQPETFLQHPEPLNPKSKLCMLPTCRNAKLQTLKSFRNRVWGFGDLGVWGLGFMYLGV